MTHLLSHFDHEKASLKKQIETTPSPEKGLEIIESYFSRLHRDMAECYSVPQYRHLGHLLESIRYAIRTLATVDIRHETKSQALPSPDSPFRRQIRSGILFHVAIAALLLFFGITTSPLSETSILLILLLMGVDGYLLHIFWKTRPSAKHQSGSEPADPSVPVEVRLNIGQTQSFLNYVADSLNFADKSLSAVKTEKSGTGIEQEIPVLKLFQDLFEARYFGDGEWALKKISAIRAILRENDIVIKDFDVQDPRDRQNFDMEPCVDSSITHPVTIRPAFIKGNRILLRGRAAEPFHVSAPSPRESQWQGVDHDS